MPRLSVYFIRTALIYLLVGVTFGGLILANKGMPFLPVVWVLLPLHYEMLFVGWAIELGMGVAFWILPRFSKGAPRGKEWMSWLAYICLNSGILILVVQGWIGMAWLGLAGKVLIFLGTVVFAYGNWMRIKPSGA